MANKRKDPFEILGISKSVSLEELERAYHNLEFIYHPDNYTTSEEKARAEEKLLEVDAAYLEAKKILTEKKSGLFDSFFEGSKKVLPVEIKDVAGEVEVIKWSLCKSIGKKFIWWGEKVPRQITQEFSEEDENVYFYLKVKNKNRSYFDLRLEWIDPYLELYQYVSNRFQQISSTTVFYAWLDLFPVVRNKLFGTWRVKLYLNKKEVVDTTFTVKEE